MKSLVGLGLGLLAYAAVMVPFSDYMQQKPFVEKLGYVPNPAVLRVVSLDQQTMLGTSLVMKVLFYYGSIFEARQNEVEVAPNYEGMISLIEKAVKLDPYNQDAYYFAQAILSWDLKRIERANELLEYGMQYRDWDFYLPFFIGFNSAYFLKDYDKAARYYRKAEELSGYELFGRLAGRYMYEAGQTQLAIGYLKTMIESTRKDSVRQTLQTRLDALQAVRTIEEARDRFREQRGEAPDTVQALVEAGFLRELPLDPYGGRFYLDDDGQVRTTSKFSHAGAQHGDN